MNNSKSASQQSFQSTLNLTDIDILVIVACKVDGYVYETPNQLC